MKSYVDIGVITLTVLAMLSVGLELNVNSFKQLTKQAVPLTSALLMQMILIPGIALLVSYSLGLSPALRSGILLVAACPVGDIANFFTLIGRGNVALSVAYNAVSCLVSPITMTIIFAGYSQFLGTHFDYAAPGLKLVLPFFLMITIPIVAGTSLRLARVPKVDRVSRFLRLICLVGVFALCAYVIAARSYQVRTDWKFAAGASALLALAAMLIGWIVSRVLKMDPAERIALNISFAVRNVGLATAIAVTIMNRIEYAVFSTIYFLSEVVLVSIAIMAWRVWELETHAGDVESHEVQSA